MSPFRPEPTHNQPEYTVSEISASIKRDMDNKYGYVRIRGEISGCKQAPSGHYYLSLKDEQAVLKAVCWRGTSQKLSFQPEDGIEVICTGKITTYAAQSSYQLVIEQIEVAGAGALMALLEKRRQQLEKEGLFANDRKHALPLFPQTIGVITSPTGAVIRDILHRLEERFPVKILLWPVLVQGEQAASQITQAIEGFNNTENPSLTPDVIIVARGGGSIEDLWPFNEEIVVRAVAASSIPLISAVGHETDTTLIDYAADKRAPTPTAAAEIAVPVRADLLQGLDNTEQRLTQQLFTRLSYYQQRIDDLARGLISPEMLLKRKQEKLHYLQQRLARSIQYRLEQQQQKLQRLTVQSYGITSRLQRLYDNHSSLSQRLHSSMNRIQEKKQQQLQSYERLLHNLDYKNILGRGFAIIRNPKKEIIHSKDALKQQQTIQIEFKDGSSSSIALNTPKRNRQNKDSSTQGDLF